GLDFLDVFKDGSGLTPRLALSYVRQLPMDSATQAALQGGPEYRGWDVRTYQSADQVDLLNWLIYVLIAVNSDKNKKPKKPEPTYRPGEKKRKQSKPRSEEHTSELHSYTTVFRSRQVAMDSATQAALLGGPEYRGWDVRTYQSADQVDLLNWLIYVLIAVNSDKNKKPKKPEPTYRPGEKKRKQSKP